MNHLVLTFIGPDRPGLVDTLSDIVSQEKGNWQTSSLHHLSGFFAGVVEIAVDDANTNTLKDKLLSIPDLNCQLEFATNRTSSNDASLVLELTANDRAGIVQEISSVIHKQGGNLVKLVSAHEAAAHTGQEVFKAKASIEVSASSVDDLIAALEATADDLMVDISND